MSSPSFLKQPEQAIGFILKLLGFTEKTAPGVAILAMHKNKPLFKYCFGSANISLAAPITPASLFDLASVSKHFTCACILLLQSQNKLKVEDPVFKYLPEFNTTKDKKRITVLNLIHHTSGLPEYLGGDDDDEEEEISTIHDVLKKAAASTLEFAPNTKHEYSNTNYVLLGVIIEKLSKMTYREFVKTHIFKPLWMHASEVVDITSSSNVDGSEVETEIKNRTMGYKEVSSEKEGQATSLSYEEDVNDLNIYGDGGILTSLDDLAKWDAALNDKLKQIGVNPALFDKYMYTSGKLNKSKASSEEEDEDEDEEHPDGYHGYAFGFCSGFSETLNHKYQSKAFNYASEVFPASLFDGKAKQRMVSHEGSWNGTSTLYLKCLDVDFSLIVLSNLVDHPHLTKLAELVADGCLAELLNL